MNRLKLLLFSSIDERSEVETRYAPIGLAGLAAGVNRDFPDDWEVRIANGNLPALLRDFAPDVVGLSCVSQNYHIAQAQARICRASSIPVLLGGVHISMLPASLTPDFTAAGLDEGEATLSDFLRIFQECRGFPVDRLAAVPGVVFFDGDRRIQTAPRPPVANLDSIPIPRHDLLPPSSHRYLFTSRGCPYRCAFCASSRFWHKVRFHSPDRVLEEIHLLVGLGARLISFYDDLFIADIKRLAEIAGRIAASDLPQRVKFTCSVRANTVTEPAAALLKSMNVVSCGLGLESGNPEILTFLKGKGITVEHNRKAVEILKRQGIKANASFVIGSPHETVEQMMDTYRFIRDTPLDLVDIYVLTPFPGTPVWDLARERGLVSDDMDWSRLNVNWEVGGDRAILLSETVTREEMARMYARFRRLRFRKNIKAVWSHPLLRDLPAILWKTSQERMSRCFRGASPRK